MGQVSFIYKALHTRFANSRLDADNFFTRKKRISVFLSKRYRRRLAYNPFNLRQIILSVLILPNNGRWWWKQSSRSSARNVAKKPSLSSRSARLATNFRRIENIKRSGPANIQKSMPVGRQCSINLDLLSWEMVVVTWRNPKKEQPNGLKS